METNENPDKGLETSSAKVVLGLRTLPGLKIALNDEASSSGVTLSEYCELILANRHEDKMENARLTQLVNDQQKEIERLITQNALDRTQLSDAAKVENEELKRKMEMLNRQMGIFSDARLLYLFNSLKGKSDTVEDPYHPHFKIAYNSVYEVLKALIYSCKLK